MAKSAATPTAPARRRGGRAVGSGDPNPAQIVEACGVVLGASRYTPRVGYGTVDDPARCAVIDAILWRLTGGRDARA
jgi:hypothetical protein